MNIEFLQRMVQASHESRVRYLHSELAHARKDRDDLTRHIDWLKDELAKLQDANQRFFA